MKWYDYLEDAKKIKTLWDSVNEIARLKKIRVVDYAQGDFVRVAKNLLDVMKCGRGEETNKQKDLLAKYIEKYEIKDGQATIDELFKELGI